MFILAVINDCFVVIFMDMAPYGIVYTHISSSTVDSSYK